MRQFFLAALAATAVTAILAGPARADESTSAQCSSAFDQCLADCNTKHGNDTAKRAACVPTCSGKYAACDAGVAYDKAKPWLEEQAEKTKKFFDGLVDELKKEPKSEPQPEHSKPI